MAQNNILPKINFELWTKTDVIPEMAHQIAGARVSNLLLIHSDLYGVMPGFCATTDLIELKTGGLNIKKGEIIFCNMNERPIHDAIFYYDTGITKEMALEENLKEG